MQRTTWSEGNREGFVNKRSLPVLRLSKPTLRFDGSLKGRMELRKGYTNGHSLLQVQISKEKGEQGEPRRNQVQDDMCLLVASLGQNLILLTTMSDNTYGILSTREAHSWCGIQGLYSGVCHVSMTSAIHL